LFHYYNQPFAGSLWWIGLLLQAVSIAVLAVVAVLVLKRILKLWLNGRNFPPGMGPLETLDILYARGLISRSQYLERRADLTKPADPAQARPALSERAAEMPD
jgi:hypothetical protein